MTVKHSILFVCMGNICRSPLAEGVFRQLVEDAGLSNSVTIDSAGTHFYHVGASPDPRSVDTAKEHSIDISQQQARHVKKEDFDTYDQLLVMDKRNLRDIEHYCPRPELMSKVKLFLDYSRDPLTEMEVPDPYAGGLDGFEHVYQLVLSASKGLLASLQEEATAIN